MAKAALYIRVSTQEQVENYSIESQRERLEAFCKSKDWNIYDTYIDGGYSGASLNRPGLQKMLSDLDKIDAVVVYKLDRLSRSQRDTLSLIEEHFLVNNVDFVSITETLDTSTPFGKAMIGILSVFAQLERETIAERMRMGHIKRAENGLRGMGGDYDPAGYKRKDGKLLIKEDEAQHVKRAFELYEQTNSITQVQSILKIEGFPVWRFRRYRDILANELYIGNVKFAGKAYKGQHDAIISEEQFERVQTLLERHKGNNANRAKTSLLSGLLTCKHCGEPFVSYSTGTKNQRIKKPYYYYICRARRFPSEYDEKCMNKNWSRDKLEKIVISELDNITIEKSSKQKDKKIIDYNKLLKEIDKKIERLITLYASNTKISSELLENQIENLNIEKEDLINKQNENKGEVTNITNEMLMKINKSFLNLEFKDKFTIIQKLIEEIEIDGDNVIINWRF